ncbi:MAG: hypothetical protein ACHQIG_11370 [Acidimicrobiia bacterium]
MPTAGSRTRRRLALSVAALVVVALAACSDDSGNSTAKSAPTTTGAATTTTTVAAAPASGTYVNGSSSVPHYALAITASPGGALSGTMTFFFQDGTKQQVFTFTGQTSGSSATLTPSTGAPITMTFANGQLTLANCSSYLQFATQASQCTFTAQ